MHLLTRHDAEIAHDWSLAALSKLERRPALRRALASRWKPDARLAQTLLDGVPFPTPFGIAAGLDKNGLVVRSLEALLSPGFIEIGTVTPNPQVGNQRPRVVRVDRDNMINAMGFPNEGVDAVVARLEMLSGTHVPIALNIGKMKTTTETDTPEDYRKLVEATARLQERNRLPDFYVVNVSSPNTPGLTSMQRIDPLSRIIEAAMSGLDRLNVGFDLRRRFLVKVGPDLDPVEVEPIIELVDRYDLGGLIATNTTIARPVTSRHDAHPGGFSGSALYDRSARTIKLISSQLSRNRVLVATGGIDSVDRAFEMLQYADLVGVYTGLILRGPGLLRRLADGVTSRMQALGVESLAELRFSNRPG